jgi:hypothetical protein
MTIAIATTTALLAVHAGVLLAALDQPQADADRRTRRWSLALLIATAATAATGVAYALIA